MIGLIAGILKPVVTGAVSYIAGEQDIKKAEKENRARLLRDEKSNNHEWEMANLSDKDKWLRRISFGIFIFPLIWAVFDPVAVQTYFDVALQALPSWYVQIVISMVGGIWGLSVLKNSVPAMIGGIIKAVRK